MIALSGVELIKRAKCNECALAKDGCPKAGKYVFGSGPEDIRNVQIAIVGEAPQDGDMRAGKPFQGNSGELLRAIMGQLNIDASSVWYANALLCNYPSGSKPSKSTVEACKDRLVEELAQLPNLKCVIALGGYAVQSLTGAKSIKQEIYNVSWHEGIGAFVIPAYHPAFCFRQIDGFIDLVWAFERALELLDKPKTVLNPTPIKIEIARSTGEALKLLNEIADTAVPTWTAIDWETDYADPIRTPTLAIGFSQSNSRSIIIPWVTGNDEVDRPDEEWDLAPTPAMIEAVHRIAANPNVKTIFHNGDFDVRVSYYNTGATFRVDYDTMLSDYSLDERGGSDELEGKSGSSSGQRVGTHRLKSSARRYVGAPDWERGIHKYLKSKTTRYSHIPRPELYKYLAYDVHYTRALRAKHEELLLKEPPSRSKYWTAHNCLHKLMLPAYNELIQIEIGGIAISRTKAAIVLDEMEERLVVLDKEIRGHVVSIGWPEEEISSFNPKSNKDLAKIIYGKEYLNITLTKDLRTSLKGQPIKTPFPTGKDPLTKLRDRHKIFPTLLDFKNVEKLRSTYVQSILDDSEWDGNVHGEFYLTGTGTGRLASRNPNLQNIPPRTKIFYEPDDDSVFVNADYKQLEVRVAAWYSRDKKLVEICRGDIHGSISKEIFANLYAEVGQANSVEAVRVLGSKFTLLSPIIIKVDTLKPADLAAYKYLVYDELRNAAKPVIFGVIYGREAYSLATGPLQCEPKEAQKYIDALFFRFPDLAKWLEKQKKLAVNDGWIESFTGRRRRFPFLTEDFKRKVLKQCVNAPCQGAASDICLTAFKNVAPKLRELGYGRILLLVHDAIGFSIKKEFLQPALALIKAEMEGAYTDPEITFEVDFKVGPSYGECEKYKLAT